MKVPTQLRETDTTILTWDQLRRALMELDLRGRILLELDMTNALRPSELLAFRWKCFEYEASTLKIMETVYKGKIRPWGKTKKSLTVIHIPRSLADELQQWRDECPDSSPEAFMFANQVGGFLDTDNFRKRVLHKLARSEIAEADVSGDPKDDCNAGPEEGDSEGGSRIDAAFSNGYDDRRLHAGDPRERTVHGQLHSYGVATGTQENTSQGGESSTNGERQWRNQIPARSGACKGV